MIGIWKYVRTGIIVCLKNQVENHSKIDNYVNNQKSKTSKSNLYKAWKENRDNMLDIKIQTSLLLLLNIIMKIFGNIGYQIWAIFWSGNKLVKFRNIKKHLKISKYYVRIHPSVILQLLMSSKRSLGIPKNTFIYLKIMSASTHQWHCRWLCHIREEKWSPSPSNLFWWD